MKKLNILYKLIYLFCRQVELMAQRLRWQSYRKMLQTRQGTAAAHQDRTADSCNKKGIVTVTEVGDSCCL